MAGENDTKENFEQLVSEADENREDPQASWTEAQIVAAYFDIHKLATRFVPDLMTNELLAAIINNDDKERLAELKQLLKDEYSFDGKTNTLVKKTGTPKENVVTDTENSKKNQLKASADQLVAQQKAYRAANKSAYENSYKNRQSISDQKLTQLELAIKEDAIQGLIQNISSIKELLIDNLNQHPDYLSFMGNNNEQKLLKEIGANFFQGLAKQSEQNVLAKFGNQNSKQQHKHYLEIAKGSILNDLKFAIQEVSQGSNPLGSFLVCNPFMKQYFEENMEGLNQIANEYKMYKQSKLDAQIEPKPYKSSVQPDAIKQVSTNTKSTKINPPVSFSKKQTNDETDFEEVVTKVGRFTLRTQKRKK